MTSTQRARSYCLGATFAVLGTLFTLFPEFLEHSPIGFEKRGIVHHGWHYLILLGGFSLVLGVWLRDRALEAFGLVACGFPVLLNLVAIFTATDDFRDTSGIDIALRLVVICAALARLVELRNEDR